MTMPVPIPAYKAPKGQRYQVRGKRASSYEYNVSLALDYYGLDYLFQVSYWGGRALSGGIVLDFLVFTSPLQTPIWVNGDYWHQADNAQLELYQQALLSSFGNTAQPVILWGQDCDTEEAAKNSIKKKVLF